MSPSLFPVVLFLLSVPFFVSACEGDCIVGIAEAFKGNYSVRVNALFRTVANQIVAELVPEYPRARSLSLISPLARAYNEQSYESMRTSIFPNHFHGKCQINGVNPIGCPNPDCPVVCGTPGSLVHFYADLRYIAFNNTRALLETLIAPKSTTYKAIEASVRSARQSSTKRMSRIFPRSFLLTGFLGPVVDHEANTYPYHTVNSAPEPRPNAFSSSPKNIGPALHSILQNVPATLGEMCDLSNDLSRCSWEVAMKKYILEFP